jgi:hypothetical protein
LVTNEAEESYPPTEYQSGNGFDQSYPETGRLLKAREVVKQVYLDEK